MKDLVFRLTGLQLTTDDDELQATFRQGSALHYVTVPSWMDLKPGGHYKITFTPVDAGGAEALRENGPGPRTSLTQSSPGADETANGRPCDSTGLHRTPDVENDRATSSSSSRPEQATHQTEESRSSSVPSDTLKYCIECGTVVFGRTGHRCYACGSERPFLVAVPHA